MSTLIESDMPALKTAVVTGGAGFIGSHIAEELVRRGVYTVILDDLSTGKLHNLASIFPQQIGGPASTAQPDLSGRSDPPAPTAPAAGTAPTTPATPAPASSAPAAAAAPLRLQSPGARFIQGSINDLPLLQEVFRGAGHVFHLAAIASVPRSIEDPAGTHLVNTTGTLNVLLAARDCGVKKLVYSSSCAVYGDPAVSPTGEDVIPAPLSPYAVSKLAGEAYCRSFEKVYGLATVCLRYFNVYGPRQEPDSPYAAVIPKWMARVRAGLPPVIYGDGEQTRDFVFVGDVVRANLHFAGAGATGVFNVGSGRSTTLNELVRLIIGLTGSGLAPIYEDARPGDIRYSSANVSCAAAAGFAAEADLALGLSKVVGGVHNP